MNKSEENVRNLILELRRAAEDPTKNNSLKPYARPEIFRSSTQAVVFEFSQPNYSVIFFTHLEKPDLAITFAANGSFSELLCTLPEKLKLLDNAQVDCRWNCSLADMHSLIEDNLRRLYVSLAQEICRHESVKFRISLSQDIAILEIQAPLLDINPEKIVERLVTGFNGPRITRTQPFKSGSRERNAHAGTIFPLTKIGAEKALTFEEKVRNEWEGYNRWDISPQSWETSWQQIPIVIFSGGMVVADTPHQDKALQAINTFLAACQYFGHDCVPMTIYDLGHLSIDADGGVSAWGGPAEISRRIFAPTKSLSEETLREIFGVLNNYEDEDSFSQMRLWHAGCSHFLSGENLQAFVLGWTAIENLIRRVWEGYLDSCAIEGGRREKLTSPQGGFTVEHIIEFLNMQGGFNSSRYDQLQGLRKIRNKTVHNGLEPNTEDTGRCLRVAVGMLSERLDRNVSPSRT